MPTAAWTGFIHSWHTLGIVLKWMCITVIGIPVAIATCLVVAIAALAFGVLCLGAVAATGYVIFYIFKGIWWFLTRIPTWIDGWRIRRAERLLMSGGLALPMTEDRSRIRAHVQQWFHRRPTNPAPPMSSGPLTISPPVPAHLAPSSEAESEPAAPIVALPGMIECQVCLDPKWPSDFPSRAPTAECTHEATDCCSSCLATAIASAFEGNIWDDIRCPSCNLLLKHEDVKEFASEEIFNRYDTLTTRRYLETTIPNFRWCLSPNCTYGEEHPPSPPAPEPSPPPNHSHSPIRRSNFLTDPSKPAPPPPPQDQPFTCTSCGFLTCSRHAVPWHTGLSCADFDLRIEAKEKKTEKIIKRIAKRCPGCKRFVNKNGGCSHMTCPCGRQWCWHCGHDYPGHNWRCKR